MHLNSRLCVFVCIKHLICGFLTLKQGNAFELGSTATVSASQAEQVEIENLEERASNLRKVVIYIYIYICYVRTFFSQ